ncbi:MAG: SRPBCC domain-containing protein [Gemmatales bacterium]
MSVKKESSGRRSVQVEVEVPGTPEEVWQAIATGPGISSWFVPAEFEEKDGKPVAVKMNFGPGMESRSEVTSWEPLQKWIAQSDGWAPGSPPIAHEWSVEAKAGGTCILRIVHSLFASTDDWDHQLEDTQSGWPAFFRTLRLYLTHFRGQRSVLMQFVVPAAGTAAEAWDSLISAVGVKGVTIGQRCSASAGVPSFSGIAEYYTEKPYDALLRIDQPGPGVAALGAFNCGGPSMVAMSFYLYGDQAAGILAREKPRWQAWFQEHFPTPIEPGKGTSEES